MPCFEERHVAVNKIVASGESNLHPEKIACVVVFECDKRDLSDAKAA